MAKKITVRVTKELPGLDVDGVHFVQDGRNPLSPDDYFCAGFTLRDVTEDGDSHSWWRCVGGGLDFCRATPEGCVVYLRELGADLIAAFGPAD